MTSTTSTTQRRLAQRVRNRRARPAEEPSPPAAAAPAPIDHFDERRARESGGPIDRAEYACQCGYVFNANVSTSVSCPNCGADQAW